MKNSRISYLDQLLWNDCLLSVKQMNNFPNDKQAYKVLIQDLTSILHCRHNRNLLKLKRLLFTQKTTSIYSTLYNNCQDITDYQNYTGYISMPVQPITPPLNCEHYSKILLTCRCVCHHCPNKCLFLCCN